MCPLVSVSNPVDVNTFSKLKLKGISSHDTNFFGEIIMDVF